MGLIWGTNYFIAALGFCGTIERNVLNWLVIVVDSEKGGSKNGSSLPVLPCGCPVASWDYAGENYSVAWGL